MIIIIYFYDSLAGDVKKRYCEALLKTGFNHCGNVQNNRPGNLYKALENVFIIIDDVFCTDRKSKNVFDGFSWPNQKPMSASLQIGLRL